MTRTVIVLASWYALFLVLLALVAGPRPARSMEHEEIVARLALGMRVPGYDTRVFRKQRRIVRGVRR